MVGYNLKSFKIKESYGKRKKKIIQEVKVHAKRFPAVHLNEYKPDMHPYDIGSDLGQPQTLGMSL